MAFVFNFRMKLARKIPRILERDDANARAGGEIDEGCGHLSPVAEFERALSQSAAGDHADRVRGAAVDLDIRNEPLAVGAKRIFDAKA